MYHHPGEYVTDFCIIRRDEIYHLFHIRGERWTWPLGYQELDLGHATSTDLRRWTPHEPVLPAGPAGAWDECGNWAPHIIEHDGLYYCFYTGSDRNNNQAIGLATSPDLYQWTKHGDNPVVRPGPWSDHAIGRDVAGRDAMVFEDRAQDRFLMVYTATMADGRACMALAQSQDLWHWEDIGPTYIEEDRSYNRLESAYIVANDDKYYLFYSAKGGPNSKGFAPSAFDHFDIVYQISDDPVSGWLKPNNHTLLTEWTCASEHPTFAGETYMFYVVQEELDGVWGASSLSDPKRMEWMADGTVRIREHLPETVQRRPLFDSRREEYGQWIGSEEPWSVPDGGMLIAPARESCLMNTLWGRNLTIETEMQLRAGQTGSLIVRGNPSAMAGYRIGLVADPGVVKLEQLNPGRSTTLLQERPVALADKDWHKLKVVFQGAFIDVYVDDVLLLVRHLRSYDEGCFGLHAVGAVRFRRCTAYGIAGPEVTDADWEYRCRPRHLLPNS